MFGTVMAHYINANLDRLKKETGESAKDFSVRVGVPESTLSNYRSGKVEKPNKDQLYRIAIGFGDSADTIRMLRAQTEEAIEKEKDLKAEAKDRALVDQIAALIRESSISLLNEYLERMQSQQTEIIQHADQRVLDERALCKARCDTVLAQCLEEIDREKRHNADLLTLKDDLIKKGETDSKAALHYLQRSVRNLSIALALVSVLAVFGLAIFGGYAAYAYLTFDREDPTRGIYRTTSFPEAPALPIE